MRYIFCLLRPGVRSFTTYAHHRYPHNLREKPLVQQIDHYARFPPSNLSLLRMARFGRSPSLPQLYRATLFIQEELPTRIAHRIRDLKTLPEPLASIPSIIKVRRGYEESFAQLLAFNDSELAQSISPELKAQLLKSSHFIGVPNSSAREKFPESAPQDVSENPEEWLTLDLSSFKSYRRNLSLYQRARQALASFFSTPDYALVDPTETSQAIVDADNSCWPPEVLQYIKVYSDLLSRIRHRHDAVVTTIANGIKEYREKYPKEAGNPVMREKIQQFLDKFYMSRLGIRLLIGQHVSLCDIWTGKIPYSRLLKLQHDGYVGLICTRTNVKSVAADAIQLARQVCEDWFGLYEAPKVELICDPDVKLMYIPAHLNHMIFEMVKNSLRATVEKYGTDPEHIRQTSTSMLIRSREHYEFSESEAGVGESTDGAGSQSTFRTVPVTEYPPIQVIVAAGKEDITIKISDQGGGIPRSHVAQVFEYMFTTVTETPQLTEDFNETMMGAPMAGFGYGLPISRLYARYFGGDVQLFSMEGYGTDVYLHLNKLSNVREPVV